MSSVVSQDFDEYESLLVTLQNILGIVVNDDQRASLLMRIESLLVSNNLKSIKDLTQSLNESDELRATLIETLSLQHSSWNLSGDINQILQDYIFPQLPERAKICVIGCGEGQLAYSVAMEISEYENRSAVEKNFQLFATASIASNLKIAEAGVYTQQQLELLNPEYRKLYVAASEAGGSFKIKDKIRKTISFLQYKLAIDTAVSAKLPKEVDLIICPEALVYFTSRDKEKIVLQLSDMLKSGGVFLTGDNQSILTPEVMSASCGLERVEHPSGDFYRCVN